VSRSDAPPRGADTVAALIATAAARLGPVSDTPRLDAELLLGEVIGLDRAGLVLERGREVGEDDRRRFAGLVARRADAEPIAYLLGRRGFRWLELDVDSRVLIPRPETELLVELGLELSTGAAVLDVGTGSGAVALALRAERPDLQVRGVDLSAEAVAVAEANARRLSLDVSFTVGDLLAGQPPQDAVLANLPYVESDADLSVGVARHEPAGALFGGPDGLDVIRRLLAEVAERCWPQTIGLEIGATQGPAVAALVAAAGFAEVEVRTDLAGRDRVVVGRGRTRPGPEDLR
jgi:release factor glutamine methyltransferase